MEPIGLKLRLAYYKAPDGPRLVIFGPLDADFSSLQKLFVQLSETPAMSCDLEEQPFVVALGGTRVRLFSTGGMFAQTRGSVQGLRRAGGKAHPNFGWSRTAEGWDYFATRRELGFGNKGRTPVPNQLPKRGRDRGLVERRVRRRGA